MICDNYGEPCPCCGYDILNDHKCDHSWGDYDLGKQLSLWDLFDL